MEDPSPQPIIPSQIPGTRSPSPSPAGDFIPEPPPAVKPSATARPSLRTRLSRHLGIARLPKQARPKTLTRPKSARNQSQAQDLRSPLSNHIGGNYASPTTSRAASTQTSSRPKDTGPRYIGLEDRHAKVAVATPTFVRKVDSEFSTDHTMATRGSGSCVDISEAIDHTQNGDGQSVNIPIVKGEEAIMKEQGLWTFIRQKAASLLFWRT
ncbi:MAG: hypothetical protein Q9168_006881 [Polycauliona sp. 1 TL-2023]